MTQSKFFTFVVLFLVTLPLLAQVSQPKRVELMLDRGEDYYTLISADKNGMVLFRETERLDRSRGFEWEFIKLDTTLTEEWRHRRFVDLKDQFLGYDYFDNHLYVLFGKGEYTYDEFWLLKLNLTPYSMRWSARSGSGRSVRRRSISSASP